MHEHLRTDMHTILGNVASQSNQQTKLLQLSVDQPRMFNLRIEKAFEEHKMNPLCIERYAYESVRHATTVHASNAIYKKADYFPQHMLALLLLFSDSISAFRVVVDTNQINLSEAKRPE